MRTEFIQTKVRPIKKMFIIESGDYSNFLSIFNEIHNEVDVMQNLFFQKNDSLWSDINKAFVRQHDPDVVLNFSELDNEIISKHFDISCITPDSKMSSWPLPSEHKIAKFGTNLFSFTNLPILVDKFKVGLNLKVYAAEKLERSPFSMINAINYGFAGEKKDLHLDLTIFKDLEIETIKTPEITKNIIFKRDKQFIHLTSNLGSGTVSGPNIWGIDYNPDHMFAKGNYIFVESTNDMSALVYFWNMRATYNYANLFWLPEELLQEYSEIIDDDTSVICFNDRIERDIRSKMPSINIIKPDRYYFNGYSDRWRCFEHNQIVNIVSDEVLFQHPAEKCFSDIGIGCACVLEVRNLKEFIYPIRRNIGNLYKPDHLRGCIPSERFYRISSKGLSKYVLHFRPLDTTGLTDTIKLPSFDVVISHLMEDCNYEMKKTTKSSIIEQVLKLLGGISEANILCQKTIFDLISSLTPLQRTEKIMKQIFGNKIEVEDAILEVGKAKENGIVELPSITLNIEQVLSKVGIKAKEKQPFVKILQKLYDKKILLRGKSFICPHCASKIWLPLEEISRQNYCHDCGSEVALPIHVEDKLESDYYRLNQLIARAVDQGQLSTLLLLNFFSIQKFSVFDFMPNVEVYQKSKLLTDMDLLLKISKKLGIAECKSNSGFDNKQVDGLFDLAKNIKCDFVVLSCLLKEDSKEIAEIIEHIKTTHINMPVFIFTEKALFDPSSIQFSEYFERQGNRFLTGPILVGQKRI